MSRRLGGAGILASVFVALVGVGCHCDDDADATAAGTGGGAGGTAPGGGGAGGTPPGTGGGNCLPCETDTDIDPNNCGTCGNVCGVGTCFGGQCQVAEELISGLPTLANIATDGSTLFFSSGGHASQFYLDSRLLAIPNTGASTAMELAGVHPSIEAVALDGDSVLFSSTGTQAADGQDGFIGLVPKTGGEVEHLASGQSFCSQISTEGEFFWITAGSWSGDFQNGRVNRFDGEHVTVLVDGIERPSRIFVDQDYVYWTSDGSDVPEPDGVVARVHRDGGAPETLVSAIDGVTAVIVIDGRVYWGAEGSVGMLDLARPGQIAEFEATLASVSLFATDGSSLYWTENGWPGRVMRKDIRGGNAVVLATGLIHPYGITLDEDYVYFTQRGTGVDDGAIFRIHK